MSDPKAPPPGFGEDEISRELQRQAERNIPVEIREIAERIRDTYWPEGISKPDMDDLEQLAECFLSIRAPYKTALDVAKEFNLSTPTMSSHLESLNCEVGITNHVLASTEPLGERSAAKVLGWLGADGSINQTALIQEIADLRAQLQAAQQHQKDSDERIVNQRKELAALSADHTVNLKCWHFEMAQLQQLADERGKEIEQRKAGLQDVLTHYRTELNERGREVERLRAALEEISGTGKVSTIPAEFLEYWKSRINPHSYQAIAMKALATPATPLAQPDEWPVDEEDGIYPPAQERPLCEVHGDVEASHRCNSFDNMPWQAKAALEHPDTARLNWLQKALEENQYHSDIAIQWDEEDGFWFAKVYRFDHGELRGEPFDHTDSKTDNIRDAIDAARTAPEAQG